MTNVDGEHEETLRMPTPWWSYQWLGMRFVYAFVIGGVAVRGFGPGEVYVTAISGLALAAAAFVGLTVLALHQRRRWAADHDDEA